MTDLDRKIAELKGWRQITRADINRINESKDPIPAFPLVFCRDKADGGLDLASDLPTERTWSQDIAKAFELVDDVCGVTFKKGAFILLSLTQEPKDSRWLVRFHVGGKEFDGAGETRPEAICRAYIALKEWEGKK